MTFTGQLGTHASRLGRIVLGYIAPQAPAAPTPGVCRVTDRPRTLLATHTTPRTMLTVTDHALTSLTASDRTP